MKTSFMHRKGSPDTMLIVDDDELNCDILANIFESEHRIVTAENGLLGLEALYANKSHICAILLDVMMPVMNGMEMLEKMAEENIPDAIPVFLITGETDGMAITRAYDLGVMDVISKPITPQIVLRRIHSVVELFAARNHFVDVVEQQTEELRHQNRLLNELNMGMIEALATATEFRSGESGEHVRRIYDITSIFLRNSPLHEQYSDDEITQIARAAILHDVGKISVPDAILNKPGKLTPEEFKIMQEHTVNGDKMLVQIPQLRNLPFFEHARAIARHHHERWDGRGYPDHLAGDDIPMSAQIVSIADVYDALVSVRVYKPPFSHEQAIEMVIEGKCGVFNPLLLEYFQGISPLVKTLYKESAHKDKEY